MTEFSECIGGVVPGVGSGLFGFTLFIGAGFLIRERLGPDWNSVNDIALYTLLPVLAVVYALCAYRTFGPRPDSGLGRRWMPGFLLVLFTTGLITGYCADI